MYLIQPVNPNVAVLYNVLANDVDADGDALTHTGAPVSISSNQVS